jgi:hypothetical protein
MWTMANPHSGYFQGLSDLMIPFLMVFLNARLDAKSSFLKKDLSVFTQQDWNEVEVLPPQTTD